MADDPDGARASAALAAGFAGLGAADTLLGAAGEWALLACALAAGLAEGFAPLGGADAFLVAAGLFALVAGSLGGGLLGGGPLGSSSLLNNFSHSVRVCESS